jgi:predicted nucleic acid-binding protein
VLVYAYDRAEHKRQGQAIDVLDRLQATGKGRLSVQCLAEFFQVTARGGSPMLNLDEASRLVELLMRAFPVFNLTQMVVLEAVRGV